MKARHNSRLSQFRKPFGARPKGSLVHLCLWAEEDKGDPVSRVYLHYAYGRETFIEACTRMNYRTAENAFSLDLPLPDEACLFFYWFELCSATGEHFYYSRLDSVSAEGFLTSEKPDYSIQSERKNWPFQITVYEPDFHTPDWMKGSLMYQIFPDRFARAKDFNWNTFQRQKQGPEYIFHKEWNEEVDYQGCTSEGYIACDFYGGSLKGIQEHLDYLQNLSVRTLYLNPIAQARSNHRYDTGDYLKVDPVLGKQEDFELLCIEAKKRGIRIILDGVYSHTGADSRYFNREGRYPDHGAYQEMLGGEESPYRDWYHMEYQKDTLVYDAWWGFPDLPVLKKGNLFYRDFICGEKGVLQHWMDSGASGFRLDVADELPENFLESLRRRVKTKDPDAVVLGEVWEDASNKVSYGHYRDFAFGHTLDCVMNYPLRKALVDCLNQTISVEKFADHLEELRQNYPEEMFHCQMNFVSTHDLARGLNCLSGHPIPESREQQAGSFLKLEERSLGLYKLFQAYAFLLTYPGCPCIYYGDEWGMEGWRDPFNRRTFPWPRIQEKFADFSPNVNQKVHLSFLLQEQETVEDQEKNGNFLFFEALRILTTLRAQHAVLTKGNCSLIQAEGGRFLMKRKLQEEYADRYVNEVQEAYFALNLSNEEWKLPKEIASQTPILPPQAVYLQLGENFYFWF